jgi:hypothetical protein
VPGNLSCRYGVEPGWRVWRGTIFLSARGWYIEGGLGRAIGAAWFLMSTRSFSELGLGIDSRESGLARGLCGKGSGASPVDG